MSGSPLADRLVEAGAWALRDACFVDPDDDTLPRFYDKDQWPDGNIRHWTKPEAPARPVIAAVLRELAENGVLVEDFGGDWQEALRALAVSVEKGEKA